MIEKSEVENIASLSRLSLNENEIENYQKELSDILDFAKKIDQLDLKNVEPTAHILDLKNINREDEVKISLSQEEMLKNSPKQKDGFIVVPKVVG